MKLKSKKEKIGIFVPPAFEAGSTRSIHNAGMGRLDKGIQEKLLKKLENSKYEIIIDCNFRNSVIINSEVKFNNYESLPFDKYFWYCEIDRSNNSYDFAVLNALSKKIKVVRDPKLLDEAMDKYTSFSKLRRDELSVSESVLVNAKNVHLIKDIIEKWGKVLLKPRRGGYGKGVTLFNNFESVRDTLEYIESTSKGNNENSFHLERFYENDIKEWVSATVIDGKIMYGYRKNLDRFSSLGNGENKVYSSDEISGGVSLCELSDKHTKLVLKAYDILGLDIVGFDMIIHNGEPIIIDVNTFPGMYPELFRQQGVDASEIFYDLICRKLEL